MTKIFVFSLSAIVVSFGMHFVMINNGAPVWAVDGFSALAFVIVLFSYK